VDLELGRLKEDLKFEDLVKKQLSTSPLSCLSGEVRKEMYSDRICFSDIDD
jgi:hypothetical protein